MATSAPNSMIRSAPRLHDELLFDEILTRLPAAAAIRFRAVCRAWNAALTSDHFIAAHGARAAARGPELLFFPPARGPATSFYACSLPADGRAPAAARELLTVGNLTGEFVVLSRKACRGLTLIFEVRASEYYVCNLSTGEHVALPPFEPAAKIADRLFGFPRFRLSMPSWCPFERSSTGLGFDPATGEHKVVRLFTNYAGQQKCEVYALGSGAGGGWRPCAGDAPPDVASFVDGLPPVALKGSLYWLLHPASAGNPHDQHIMSLSVGAEQLGWVHTPPQLSRRRIRHLADLDGSLCAVVHNRLVADAIELLTWSGAVGPSSSWSTRCRIDLDGLPRPMSDELSGEREVVPLCSGAGGKKILLATSRHRVYAYDPESGGVEKVFSMQDYVDVPRHHSEARLLVNIGLHEERIVGVRRQAAEIGDRRLQVKLGGNTVDKREASFEVYQEHQDRDDNHRKLREFLKHIVFPNHHLM